MTMFIENFVRLYNISWPTLGSISNHIMIELFKQITKVMTFITSLQQRQDLPLIIALDS